MRIHLSIFLIIVIPCFLMLLGCTLQDNKVTIGVSFETLQTEYWVVSVESIHAACQEHDIQCLEAIANGDANRQFEQVNNFIARGVEGIIVAPKDAHTVIPIIKAANRADIPIVIYNRRPAKNEGEYINVVADNYEITKKTVEYMCERAKEKGENNKAMILIGDLGDVNAVDRRRGFNDAIAQYPETIDLVAEIPTEWNQEKALAGVTNALQAHPDINFIFTSSDFLLPAIVSAIKTAGKYHPVGHKDHVILGGFDGDATAWRMLKEGYLDADGVQNLYFETEASVKAILDIRKGIQPENVIVDTGFVIHQGNMDKMAPDMWGANTEQN